MSVNPIIKVNALIDNAKLNKFLVGVFVICLIGEMIDGYDMNIFGVIIPSLMQDLSFTPVQTGAVASYAGWGMILGSLFFSTFADKIGTRKAIIIGIVIFTLLNGMLGFATEQWHFLIVRVIAGFFMGGLIPCLVSMVTEYSPMRMRGLFSTFVNAGVPVGSMTAAVLGVYLIPAFGWQIIFFLSFPMIILAVLFIFLVPESMTVHIKNAAKEKIGKILQKIEPSFKPSADDVYEINKRVVEKGSVTSLFAEGFRRNTILFWITMFMNMFTIFGISTWLPKIMITVGYPMGQGLWLLFTLQLGAIVGNLTAGFSANRFGYQKMFRVFFILTAVFIACLGFFSANVTLMTIGVFIVGAGVNGCQGICISYISQNHPLHFRTTALGWSLAAGRLGMALAPIFGGVLLSANVSITTNFFAFAVAPIVALITISLTQDNTKFSREDMQPEVK